ncbi:PWI domain [Macleaya cordata]|uniref:PWI domain n=1 Tax=Macleaya cordata TaxID=56857 RepID=A0A200QYL7_MACCD|nr:PWI domain [Macleaya cordata]
MSGGFFRGTSADQDTRFSNKQAKLLKSQKFAPELDHLVDITKVKMDVVRPWIANRVTELLGFEDEVLINFIYGLLDGKDINGKEVQIQLTGFMEKNTGKFMKELWGLLLSAQKNASGVPQQFLDAKEEEIRKKKEESDRITLEIQKKKEVEQEKLKKMDSEVDVTRSLTDAIDPTSKHLPPRTSSAHKEEDKEAEERNGSRGKNRLSRSPRSADRAPSSELSSPRSISKSFSNSRSYSDGRNKSRSMSRSPPRRRSISPERRYRSPRKRSMSPRRRHSPRRPRSPLRRRSPHSRRRSTSRSWRRSSSIGRRRSPSPVRRRSPSPVRRGSPSPVRRRSFSPLRRESPSPVRRRSPSPVRRRSPSPVRRRSPPPMRRRSPSPRRRRSPSPVQRRSRRRSPTPRRISPSPLRRRSPSPPRRRSPSPVRRRSPPPRSPKQRRRSPMRSPRQRNRSRSPYRSRSPVFRSRRSLSRDREIQTNGVGSRRSRDDYASQRARGKRSPVRHTPEREEVELSGQDRKALDPVARRPPISLRSPQREPRNRSDGHKKVPVLTSPEGSPSRSESSPRMGKVISRDDKSPSESPVRVERARMARADSASPVRQRRDHASRRDSPDTSGGEEISHARGDGGHRSVSPRKRIRHSSAVDNKNIPSKNFNNEEYSPKRFAGDQSGEATGRRMENLELRKKDRDRKSEKASVRAEHPGSSTQHVLRTVVGVEYGPGRIEDERSTLNQIPDEQSFGKKRSREGSVRGDKTEALQKSRKRVDNNRPAASDSDYDSEDNEKYRSEEMEKRKHKRSDRHQMASDDDASYDSQIDARKEAKRRRKEEKRLKKEERRRRREERHRKREERRAGRLKAKSMDTVPTPSHIEKNRNVADDVDGDVASKRESNPSDIEETETEQKKLEIELRKKALESLRAKKASNP